MFVRRLTESDLEAVWMFRLRSLRDDPEAFGSTYEATLADGKKRMLYRLRQGDQMFYLGAFEESLVGIVMFTRGEGVKEQHKGLVTSMSVLPEKRGYGIGKSLMRELIAQAKQLGGVEQLELGVVATNLAARRLYHSLGFEVYGTEPRALKLGEQYWDQDLMVLDLR